MTRPVLTEKTLLIVYYSKTGGSEAMASAAAGAAHTESGVRTLLLKAPETGHESMLSADGYIFVCPENLAAMAGGMKLFFDECYYPLLGRIEGRPYAAMICAGSDGQNASHQLERIATGWRLKKVAETLIVCTHAQTPEQILAPKRIGAEHLRKCAETGATLAAGLALGIF
jgi:flavodoxin